MDIFKWFRKKEKQPIADSSCCHCIPPEYNTPQVYYIKFGDPPEENLDVKSLLPKKRRFSRRKHFSGEVKRFIEERCEIGEKNYIKTKNLYDEYCSWGYANSIKKISIERFGAAIYFYGKKLGITKGRRIIGNTSLNYYVGVKLKKILS